jgi:hypothetical protein
MDKPQIIAFIEGQLALGKISKTDLSNLIHEGAPSHGHHSSVQPAQVSRAEDKADSSKNLINVFYIIGGLIAVIGVVILVVQNWEDIGFAGRMFVTIGIAFATYVAGLFLRKPEQAMISQVMFTIAAALAPIGLFVVFDEANMDFEWGTQALLAAILALIFGVALWVTKRNILVLLTTGFVSWAYYGLVIEMFGLEYGDSAFLKWATMFLGVSYILVAFGYGRVRAIAASGDGESRSVQNVLYGLGTLGILGAGIFVGGAFDLFLIALIFGAFYGGVYLKSRSMLVFGALFLMAHLIKLTSKYFVDSIGWSVALIISGFFVIGVGYLTFYLNKKFISSR